MENFQPSSHIFDPVRTRIAVELLSKELAKALPSADIRTLGQDVQGWQWRPGSYQLEAVYSFWGGFEGVLGGLKLKPLVEKLTAGNYAWSRTALRVNDMWLSSRLEQLNKLADLEAGDAVSLAHVARLLERDQSARAEQLRIVESFSHADSPNPYPIIAQQKEGRTMVLDGNRRCLRALLRGEQTIDAWLCQTNNEPPRDYWVPVGDMMRLVKLYDRHRDNQALRQHIKTVLTLLFADSAVAKIAYRQRVQPHSPAAAELAEGLL